MKEKEVAVNVWGGAQERRGPSLASWVVLAQPGRSFAEIEKVVYEELERVKDEAVADWELEKARMQVRRQRAQQLQSTLARAILLGQYAVYYNDPGLLNTLEQKIHRVTKDDIQVVARTYLRDSNRTVITTVPKPKAAPPPASAE